MNLEENVLVYADGSSSGNPGPGGWGAVILHGNEVIELGGGEKHTTNNRMELTAAIEALSLISKKISPSRVSVTLRTDSQYVINGITKWIFSWKRNGWKTAIKEDVTNRDLWEALEGVTSPHMVTWEYVKGHAGIPGNERADEIATGYSLVAPPPLYSGPYEEYGRDLLKLTPAPQKTIYLSLVNGVIQQHATWKECEARVKGIKGAKYKKVPAEDISVTLKSWGLS